MSMINIKYEDEQGEKQELYTNGWNGHPIDEFLKDRGINPENIKILSVNTED
jgi:hypothetical protein